MLYPELRQEVCRMNQELPKQGLVVWSGGNVSGVVRETNHVVIKPSGVPFEELTPENMIVTDLDGHVIEGDLKPSVDIDIHLYIYKHRLDIGGICHTHAPYSTSFALLEQPIPAALTPIAHLLGRSVPCTQYVIPASLETAQAIIETIGDGKAVLVSRHGPFTLGKTPTEAVKIATYLEEAAKTIHLAMLRGNVTPIPDEEIDRSYNWYIRNYGQKT
ncbi:MAG: L-ribulose-5-phosphate 4-epimerase [Anaerolineae bacterium]|jgi:L-ribulose-5-phosphate 4-epimerase|nr:MAG: L-ribulose-5-phosphate 4-epimerase [Anaerolineae bacterium]